MATYEAKFNDPRAAYTVKSILRSQQRANQPVPGIKQSGATLYVNDSVLPRVRLIAERGGLRFKVSEI